jgi:hypothetical protein
MSSQRAKRVIFSDGTKLEAAGLLEAAKLVAEATALAAARSATEIAAIMADPIAENRRAYLASL